MAKQSISKILAIGLSKVAFFIKTKMGKSTFLQGKNIVPNGKSQF
jgi:hypothetical protein